MGDGPTPRPTAIRVARGHSTHAGAGLLGATSLGATSNAPGNVLVMKLGVAFDARTQIGVRWASADTLVVGHRADRDVGRRESRLGRVVVQYRTTVRGTGRAAVDS
jgi:hypothetical protein